MKIYDTECPGVKIIESFSASDIRGGFTKIFNDEVYREAGLDVNIKETYYSTSCKNVIRGMHFQIPPYEHAKIVHVIKGAVEDVILDLRIGSPTYNKVFCFNLSSINHRALYIPVGMAHGFKCLEDQTLMLYQVTSIYNKASDKGIRFNSIGFNWNTDECIVSDRDNTFIKLDEFISPFKYEE